MKYYKRLFSTTYKSELLFKWSGHFILVYFSLPDDIETPKINFYNNFLI